MTRTVVRCTIEMDLVEGEDFNTIGFDEDPIRYASEEQAHFWAKNTFIEYIEMYRENGLMLEEYVQTKIVEEPS